MPQLVLPLMVAGTGEGQEGWNEVPGRLKGELYGSAFCYNLSAFALALGIVPAYAADEASCQQMFEKVDANKDGTVAGQEVTPLAAAYKASDPTVTQADAEVTITKEQFSQACMKDAFKDVQMPQ